MGHLDNFVPKTDFYACTETVKRLWDSGHRANFHPTPLFTPRTLTYEGCIAVCGIGGEPATGFSIWHWDDILNRFNLWLVPAVVLVAHYRFPATSLSNSVCLVARHLSDPIDSTHSLLSRLEVQKRFLILVKNEWARLSSAKSTDARIEHCRKIAVVLAAFEVFGFNQFPDSNTYQTAVKNILTDTVALNHISKAAYDLTSNATEPYWPTIIAILGYLGAILGAFIRTKLTRENNQTSHTIAVVVLISYHVTLVLLSNTIGTFRVIPDAMNTLMKLRRKMELHYSSNSTTMYPYLPFIHVPLCHDARASNSPPINTGSDLEEGDPDHKTLRTCVVTARWSGINSSFRPHKTLPLCNQPQNRHKNLLLLCSLMNVVGGCYIPALFLSYYSGSIGFGCRCLAWTIILSGWFLSFGFNFGLKRCTQSARVLWRLTVIKDFFFATLVVGFILAMQIGVLNSCACRSNAWYAGLENGVNLFGFSGMEWARNWVVWPMAASIGFFLMFFFGYLFHVIVFPSLDVNREERPTFSVANLPRSFIIVVKSGWRWLTERYDTGLMWRSEEARHKDLMIHDLLTINQG
jgi:hypothetical protein